MRFCALAPILALLVIGICISISSIVSATPFFFILEDESVYTEGCIDSECDCFVIIIEDFTGSFVLEPVDVQGDWQVFEITDICWAVDAPSGSGVTGTGTYELSDELQRMTLDVLVGTTNFQLDSGFVPNGADFPDIDILVGTGTNCYNVVMHIVATGDEIIPNKTSTWGRVKSLY